MISHTDEQSFVKLILWKMHLFNNPPAVGYIIFLFFVSNAVSTTAQVDWPQFRGPDGQGHAPTADVPLRWSESENIRWKVPIAGKGWSSPVVSRNRIWLTTAVNSRSLRAVCIDRNNGAQLHDIELFVMDKAVPMHSHNSLATPTAILDGNRIFVHFGTYGTACLSTNGQVNWKTSSLKYQQPHGPASSPVVHNNLLLLNCDGIDNQFVVALDKRTGKVVWKQPRQHLEAAHVKSDTEPPDQKGFPLMAYSTPLVINVDGVEQLVSTAADHVAAYNLTNGEELWWCGYDGFSLVARPVYREGYLFVVVFLQQSQPALFAIQPNTMGEVTEEELIWKRTQGVSFVPSPLLVNEELYMIEDGGVAICLDAATGKEHWKERIGGNYSASPVAVGNRIYLLSQEGKGTVFQAGTMYHHLETNQLEGHYRSSPAVAGNSLFVRSETHLYCIQGELR